MANPLNNDANADAGSELFSSYETDFKLIQADLGQKLDQLSELNGEPRNAAVSQATRALEEAEELISQMRLEKQNIPTSNRVKVNLRFRNYESDLDQAKRRLKSLADPRAALFSDRYTDDPSTNPSDAHFEQRQQLLSGTDRLDRSTQRLLESQRLANSTEEVGNDTLMNLRAQSETIQNFRGNLLESESNVDRSIKTLRSMTRRMATNRVITIAIITVLVILILAVIYSKFK